VARYRKRISGALLDRMDLFVEVNAVEPGDLQGVNGGESSATIRSRVLAGRQSQQDRAREGYPPLNSQLTPPQLDELCPLSSTGRRMIDRAAERFGLTARGYHRVLRVARTIADLDGSEAVEEQHLAEALQYRPVIDDLPTYTF
jgi:magnesium chelatase family protein